MLPSKKTILLLAIELLTIFPCTAQDTNRLPTPVVSFKTDAIQSAPGAEIRIWPNTGNSEYNASAKNNPAPYLISAADGAPAVASFDESRHPYLIFKRPVQDDFTIICVFRCTHIMEDSDGYSDAAGLIQGEVNGVVSDFGLGIDSKGQVVAGTGMPDVSIRSAPGFNDGRFHIAIFRRTKQTGEIKLYVDGAQVASGTGGSQTLVAPARLGLGAQFTGSAPYTGDIGEVEIYATALSDSERSLVEEALRTKWNSPQTAQ